jgi:hypothetical protein
MHTISTPDLLNKWQSTPDLISSLSNRPSALAQQQQQRLPKHHYADISEELLHRDEDDSVPMHVTSVTIVPTVSFVFSGICSSVKTLQYPVLFYIDCGSLCH